MSAWREDPELRGRFLPEHPDDLQVMVHEGEPRRTQRPPEGCWVRVSAARGRLRWPVAPAGHTPPLSARDVSWAERPIYTGALLNQPHGLTHTPKGSQVLFVFAPGLPMPLQVSERYLEERSQWAITPCNACGADQTLDPPTVMAKTRFPEAPEGSFPIAFTAFCPCGGTMMLSFVEGAARGSARGSTQGSAQGSGAAAEKPWWKLW